MKPIDYDNLDPGIRGTVRLLRSHGFDTVDSGDGVSKMQAPGLEPEERDCVNDFPHVVVRCSPDKLVATADHLAKVIRGVGIRLDPLTPDPSAPTVQASYDPADGSAIVVLCGVTDADLAGVDADA